MLSGTKLRQLLSEGEMPPAEFSRPEVLRILMDYYRPSGSAIEVGMHPSRPPLSSPGTVL